MNYESSRGLMGTRFLKSLLVAKGDYSNAVAYASGQGWGRVPEILKSAISAHSTGDAGLVAAVGLDILSLVRPLEIIGRLAGLRRVPFNISLVAQSAGGSAGWIGEGKSIAISRQTYDAAITLVRTKVSAIDVKTEEFVRSVAPNADAALSRDVTTSIVQASDTAFIDPANAGVTDVKPASVTYGAPTFTASGTNAAAIDADTLTLQESIVNGGGSLETAYWITHPVTAVHLSRARDSGSLAFPGINAKGGFLAGLPVITSASVPRGGSPLVSYLVLVDAARVWVAEDDAMAFSVGKNATLQMQDDPSQDSVTPTPTTQTSMFMTNSVALRSTRVLNFKAAAGAVAVLAASY